MYNKTRILYVWFENQRPEREWMRYRYDREDEEDAAAEASVSVAANYYVSRTHKPQRYYNRCRKR